MLTLIVIVLLEYFFQRYEQSLSFCTL